MVIPLVNDLYFKVTRIQNSGKRKISGKLNFFCQNRLKTCLLTKINNIIYIWIAYVLYSNLKTVPYYMYTVPKYKGLKLKFSTLFHLTFDITFFLWEISKGWADFSPQIIFPKLNRIFTTNKINETSNKIYEYRGIFLVG